VAVRDVRDRVIAILSERFAGGDLELEEFDRRVTLAHRASGVAEIEALVADLKPTNGATLPVPASALAPTQALVPAAQVREKQTLVAIMGGTQRQGQWTSPRSLRVFTLMGGVELDFREARLPSGVTDVSVFTCMGGVHIIVPPSLAVEVGGVAIMGGFDHVERAPVELDPERPVVRVHGFVLMGGVSIETRLPGESAGDARRRRRKERKLLRAKND
jgi:hypothetical protein